MILIEAYEQAVVRSEIQSDPAQRDILQAMQRVVDQLSIPAWRRGWQAVTGLYLYGPVGVGKTYLGNLFYQYVPIVHKARFHLHQLMQFIDSELRRLQGHRDPLRAIAAQLSKTTRLLFIDEFMVNDVADAMILAELLQALFSNRVVLVATSNIAPDGLYEKGVQRARFLPAIALIKSHCEILSLAPHADYRLGRKPLEEAYYYPLNKPAHQQLIAQFSLYNPLGPGSISVQHRDIVCVNISKQAVWFLFDVICNLPRCQLDYLELAMRFDVIFVSDMPQLFAGDTVRVVLLMHLIDVLYDRGTRLVMSAAVPVEELYTEGPLRFAFQRTLSRLIEMQSMGYPVNKNIN